MSTNGSENVAEGCVCLGVPGGLLYRNGPIRMECISQEHHQTVQPEETGRAALNRQVRPLALCFHSQMGPTLFVGHFDGPALDEVFDNLHRALCLIGRE